ncbi:MAG: 3-oxoacyl-ACP reductase FabG [Halobacteriovoraceae bacterium]|jgi:3-oxoacyl-[acyl-carrier protein] reductase|nr:3-oxoacyl-ACP reductase FabG [Halobacteriovoraceae bacterium]MBT5094172.1 3-oxoacyl-ACP reductase FabG [Halobacteriovoraceae bacterium]
MNASFPDLKDKICLVTGASRGIGKTIAEGLARQGAHVVFNYREGKEGVAEELKAGLSALGASNVTPLKFDITNCEETKSALTGFVKEHGPITGIVNNAGISRDGLFLRLKESDLDDTLNTNLKGAIMLTQALSRSLLKAENASIVNLSSIVGLMGNSGQIAYAASKAGLVGFTKSLAKEMASRNVRCNAICPGFIETDMTDALDEKTKEGYLESIPLKRLGASSEVSDLVAFLLSRASSYITGEIIKIDGGLYI